MRTKNILALILVVVLVFAALVACTPTTPDDPQQGGPSTPDDGPEIDFDGEDFYFRGTMFPKAEHDYTQEEIEDGAIFNMGIIDEALLNRLLDVEKRYNCLIHGSMEMGGVIDNPADMAVKISSGEVLCDIMYSGSSMLRDLYLGGFVADLATIEAIDLTNEAKWGGETILKLAQCNGVQYGIPFVGARTMPYLVYFYGIMLQKDSAFKAYDTDWTVWELYDKNEWTWDKFIEVLPEVGSDDPFDPHYAFAVNSTSLINACLSVNEAPIVMWDSEKEKYVYGYTNQATEEAIEFVRDLYDMSIVCQSTSSIEAFNHDSYTFVLSNAYRVYGDYPRIVTTGSYSWIPFPYGPHSVYGESTPTYCRDNCETLTSVFKGTAYDEDIEQETQRNGIIYNALMDELQIGDYTNYEEYVLHNIWEKTDERGWDVYKQYSANVHSPYADEIGAGLYNTITARLNACCDDRNVSVAGFLGSLEENVNVRLDETMNNQ